MGLGCLTGVPESGFSYEREENPAWLQRSGEVVDPSHARPLVEEIGEHLLILARPPLKTYDDDLIFFHPYQLGTRSQVREVA